MVSRRRDSSSRVCAAGKVAIADASGICRLRGSIYRAAPRRSYADLRRAEGRRPVSARLSRRQMHAGFGLRATGEHWTLQPGAHKLVVVAGAVRAGSWGRGASMRSGARMRHGMPSQWRLRSVGALAETVRRATIRTLPRLSPAGAGTAPISQPLRNRRAFCCFPRTDLWRHGGFAHGGVLVGAAPVSTVRGRCSS